MDYISAISAQLKIRPEQAAAAIELLDAGNTLPFIARYRKEATGGLDETQIRQISELLARLRSLDERRETILRSIEQQGKLTPDLKQALLAATSLTMLEDYYQPYKPKRRTRASQARENGLQPLADLILQQARGSQSLDVLAEPFLNEKVADAGAAWAGACDIVAETISDHPQVRQATRQKAMQWGILKSEKIDDAQDARGVYQVYYDFEVRVDRVFPHQILAINRGETEKILRVRVVVSERDWQGAMRSIFRPDPNSPLAEKMQATMQDSAERLLLPAIERDVRRNLSEKAESHAIQVFAENLRALLNQPVLVGYTVLGIDPGFRTGCKVTVVDLTGKVLETATVHPHEPQKLWKEARDALAGAILRHGVNLVSIGNGTASRETEQLVAELIHTLDEKRKAQDADTSTLSSPEVIIPKVAYLITNEAGASVYSASPLAGAELPDLDVSMRGAVSIARRVQDPLAELVKIDPKSIGVGLYQHDVDQKLLTETLQGVVESVVNQVGVDLNTASIALLTYIAGIGPKLAERIVAVREANGPFRNRQVLLQVPGLGPKAFEQAAGFLRIRSGGEPLDASAIHPESYDVARRLLKKAGLSPDSAPAERKGPLMDLLSRQALASLAGELGSGELTLTDIIEQLIRPGRDPRQDLPAPVFRSDVLKIEDLAIGTRLKGTVRNVVDFGVFVDVGVKVDGLLHRSQIPPGRQLRVGEVVQVKVLKVEAERGRIGLSLAEQIFNDEVHKEH